MPTRTDRFFEWMRSLGILRQEGWLGGVCAGIAARLRVDPIIVRGIAVVAAVVGLPALFLYALAWALLPDADGDIPLRTTLQRRFDPSVIAIAIVLVAGVFPMVPWFFASVLPYGYLFDGGAYWLTSTVSLLAATVLIVLFVLWRVSRRASAPRASAPAPRSASAAPDAPGAAAGAAGIEGDDTPPGGPAAPFAAPSAESASEAALLDEPPTPGVVVQAVAEEVDDDVTAWRVQHDAWKAQDEQWRRQQQDADRLARQLARQEREERAAAFAAVAAERRRVRRAVSPRAPLAFIAVALGLAVVVGTFAALQQGGALAPALGLFVGALLLGGAMILAGALRRRSGFLAFATALTLAGGLVAVAVPTADAIHLGGYGISNIGGSGFPASSPFIQPWGSLTVSLDDTGGDGETYIQKRDGSTFIMVMPGVAVDLEITTRRAALYGTDADGDMIDLRSDPAVSDQSLPGDRTRYTGTLANGENPSTRERIVIDQDAGYVEVYLEPGARGGSE
jgi:phage shock protein PspC (stress-responsive transcriptional regulator)